MSRAGSIFLLLLPLAFLVSVEGISAQDTGQRFGYSQRLTESLQYEGVKRTWHIYLPPGFSKNTPSPLVIALHGGGGNGRKFDQMTTEGTLTAAADKRGVVLVFPEAMNRQWHDGRKEIVKGDKIYDDVGFISRLIDVMVEKYAVDTRRIYATGISNGGFMSIRLAMDLSGKIAAVAPVTAQISRALAGRLPMQPISIMIVNGTADPLVPYDGGTIRLFRFGRSRGEILSTTASFEHFRRHNGCDQPPVSTKLPDNDPEDETTVEITRYTDCRSGSEVVLIKVIGGGHTWPGGKQYLRPRMVGKVSREVNASEMILDFFLRHTRS